MSSKRYTEEFKIEAVRQVVTTRGANGRVRREPTPING